MPAHIAWENEAQWRDAVVRALDDWDSGLRANMGRLAELAEREAKARCPVDTGRLRNGVQTELDTGEAHSDVQMVLFDDVPYAPFVEFGTRFMRAQPFLRPGLAAAQAHYEREMIQGLR